MTREAGANVQPLHLELECQHRGCDHTIETRVRASPALVFGGSARLRCGECGRTSPYQEGDRPEAAPGWFVNAHRDDVQQFGVPVDVEGDA